MRYIYPAAGGEPKYYEQDGWIREMNGKAAFVIQGRSKRCRVNRFT